MTDKPEEGVEQPQQVFVPVAAQTPLEPEQKKEEEGEGDGKGTKKSKRDDLPVGQIAVGGAGATVLGSYALASVVGPWGWVAAPAAAAVGGAGYLAYRQRRKRGGERSTKTTITRTRTRGGGVRGGSLGGVGRGSSLGRSVGASTSAKRSGGLGSSTVGRSRSGGFGGSGATKSFGGRGATPRAGSTPRGSSGGLLGRGAAPRNGGGSATPRWGSGSRRTGGGGSGGPRSGVGSGLFGRGSSPNGSSGSKRKSTPPGGNMARNRWGGTAGSTSDITKPGRFRRAGARARDWADDKTGRRISTGWRAARDKKGFGNRRKAARSAVREAGGGWFLSGLFGFLAAVGTAIASLFGGPGKDKNPSVEEDDPTSANPYHPVYTWLADGTPFIYLIPKTLLASTDPLRFKHVKSSSPTTTSSTAPTGGSIMSGLPAAQIAHDMAGAMARYEPADAYQVAPDSRQWADVPTQVAFAVKAYADRLEGARFPINEAINDKLREFAQAIAATRAIAEEIEPLMRKAHAKDLERQEAPRGDESKWNIH